MKDSALYREYKKAQASGETIKTLSERLGIARATIYLVVKRVKEGDKVKLKNCVKESGLACIWEHMYKSRAEALADGRDKETVAELKEIIRGMRKDGFSSAEIGRRLGKHHTTILSHWN